VKKDIMAFITSQGGTARYSATGSFKTIFFDHPTDKNGLMNKIIMKFTRHTLIRIV
jgi:hypothetical protein